MSRLFTFGCSFTSYIWPTWADILAARFDEHQNWGRAGGGNQFIANSLVECHLKNKISCADTVAIMWSNVSRIDSYKDGKWILTGNMYTNSEQPAVVRYFDDARGLFIRDLASIYLAHQLIEKIGCRHYIFSMTDILNPTQYGSDNASDLVSDMLPFYQETLSKIRPSVHKVIFNYDWSSRPFGDKILVEELQQHYQKVAGPDWPEFNKIFEPDTHKALKKKILREIFNLNKWDWKTMLGHCRRSDLHPTPLEHIEYLAKVLPEEPTSSETYDVCKQIEDWLQIKYSSKTYTTSTIVPQSLKEKIYKSTLTERW